VADAHDATNAGANLAQRVVELEAAWAAERKAWLAERQALTVERDNLRLAYDNLRLELELLRRRLFVAKAERVDTAQLELEFAGKLAALDALNRELGLPPLADGDDPAGGFDGP